MPAVNYKLQEGADGLVEIVGAGMRASDGKCAYMRGFYGNNIIQILQSSLNQQELLGSDQQPVLLKKLRIDDCIGNSGFIFQA